MLNQAAAMYTAEQCVIVFSIQWTQRTCEPSLVHVSWGGGARHAGICAALGAGLRRAR